jgi:hypothetical protein
MLCPKTNPSRGHSVPIRRHSARLIAQREERGDSVHLALLRRRKDLLVTRLDLLPADWPAFVLLLQPTGEQGPVELEGVHGAEGYPRSQRDLLARPTHERLARLLEPVAAR